MSSHEVAQGYKDVVDPSVWVSFPFLNGTGLLKGAALIAWTTTPWTLPSNMAACVHPDYDYAVIEATHAGARTRFVLLESKMADVFSEDADTTILGTVKGSDLEGLAYEPLFTWEGGEVPHPGTRRHVVLNDTFVTDEDGTGVVHLAPYGADDFRIAQSQDLYAAMAVGVEGRFLVELPGVEVGTFFADANKALMRDMKERGRLVKQAQYKHSYPHCWRTDKPLFYYPAPAWFIRTTAFKDRMVAENERIRWSPSEIGSGRFGEWLENNIDWALSRDRYWGTPLPVWVNESDSSDWLCVSSFDELAELAGGLPDDFDPHRPVVDAIAFETPTAGKTGTMRRVSQVIDCWFDSGAMPLAQYHWPFENRELVAEQFPADFICEGLDQTRGWFYTLHAISIFLTTQDESLWESGELFGEPLPRLREGSSYKSVMVNGLLLDKNGQKMSKRLGNIVNPHEAFEAHGADAVRWGLLGGGAAHLSRRYDDRNLSEVRRRVFGTLTASYDFFSLYANTESWSSEAPRPPLAERASLDRWMLSRAVAAATESAQAWEDLEPARALRVVERLVVDELSNWYIRRSRRRFWGGGVDGHSAFATLFEVLETVSCILAPVAPFLADALWRRLGHKDSVHLATWPAERQSRDLKLEQAMAPILVASSLGRGVRERVQIRVRQPLAKLICHVAGDGSSGAEAYESILQEELNVKEIEWVTGTPNFLQVRAKANFKTLGRRAGKNMKALAAAIGELDRTTLFGLQSGDSAVVSIDGADYTLGAEDVILETLSADGMEAATDGTVTIGLVTELTAELTQEGLAREIMNRIQTQRKESGLSVSDRISVEVFGSDAVQDAVREHGSWMATEVLAPAGLALSESSGESYVVWDLPNEQRVEIRLEKTST